MTGNKLDERVIVAGSGGQGVLLLGKLLCKLMMEKGKHVTYVPAYGAEVRGGTCNCHVRLSDMPIYSPQVERATSLVLMNQPSYKRFREIRADGGLLFVNSSVVEVREADVPFTIEVPASGIADELGDIRAANMALLGALNEARGLSTVEAVEQTIRDVMGEKRGDLAELNIQALLKGAAAARRQAARHARRSA